MHAFGALLRLNDEVLGPSGPAEFIPVAEELGLIGGIGEWVLREACRQWSEWAEDGKHLVSMAVNISDLQLKSGDFPAFVRNVLAQMRMPAELLELELTETGIFTQAGHALLELKAMGVRIAGDDFGIGFSSLSSLHGSPVDCVKIDRSFVRDAASTPGTLPFIRTIVPWRAVLESGCDILQGYLLSHPYDPEKASLLLQARETDGWDAVESGSLVGAPVL